MRLAIMTSDNYVDAVPYSLKALYKIWSDCPYSIDVVCDSVEPDVKGFDVNLMRLGKQSCWMASILSYMMTCDEGESFIWWLDDYMTVYVNRGLMATAEEVLSREDVGMVRLVPTPGPTLRYDYHKEVGEIDKKADYSLSLQATMWDCNTLNNVLINAVNVGVTTPWGFELRGSRYLASWGIEQRFLGLYRSAISYKNLYRRGKKMKDVDEWLKNNL